MNPAGRVRIGNIMPIAKDYSCASQSFLFASFLFARLMRAEHERAKLLMVDFDLDVVGGADGFELRSEVCGDEDESLVFFQAGMM